MAACEKLAKCPFFNDRMADMPATANIYKQKYCQDDFSRCARFFVSKKLGPDRVPADLFPNQMDKALELANG